ncbi:MAG: electron transfer flavoprotein subunit alpha/FixB family protein, partial [Crocinitomicaceae bacterium]|nr:electron transfer flavoprotein subunit alpha/FixB family protein [Crocinitomicaceae bacterium]
MSILVFVDHHHGKFPKGSLEAVSYAAKLAGNTGTDCVALTYGKPEDTGVIGRAGAKKVLVSDSLSSSDSQQLCRVIIAAANAVNANTVVFSHDVTGKLVAPRVAARLDAGIVPGVTTIPDTNGGFSVHKNVFSGKAIAEMTILSEKKVLTVMPNSFGVTTTGAEVPPEVFSADPGSAGVRVKELRAESDSGGIPLPEAELVVSAGRGLKGPENWGIIEELAKELGAATACSRPVSD